MLEKLDEIEWGQLEYGHGYAEHVPKLLRSLLSADPKTSKDTLEDMWDSLCHQGSNAEAAGYTAPFLVELLKVDLVQNKDIILGLLSTIDYGTGTRHWNESAKLGHDAFLEGFPTYLSLLDDQNPQTVKAAINILTSAHFGVHHNTIISAFEKRWQHANPNVRARYLWGLEQLIFVHHHTFSADRLEGYRQLFQTAETVGQPHQVRLAAIFAMIKVFGGELSETAAEVLVNTVVTPLMSDQQIPRVWHRVGAILDILYRLTIRQSVPIFAEILARIDDPHYARKAAVTLLDRALKNDRESDYIGKRMTQPKRSRLDQVLKNVRSRTGKYMGTSLPEPEQVRALVFPKSDDISDIRQLTPLQRQAIRAVLDAKAVWAAPNNLLEMYGLPASPDEVRRLLDTVDSGPNDTG